MQGSHTLIRTLKKTSTFSRKKNSRVSYKKNLTVSEEKKVILTFIHTQNFSSVQFQFPEPRSDLRPCPIRNRNLLLAVPFFVLKVHNRDQI